MKKSPNKLPCGFRERRPGRPPTFTPQPYRVLEGDVVAAAHVQQETPVLARVHKGSLDEVEEGQATAPGVGARAVQVADLLEDGAERWSWPLPRRCHCASLGLASLTTDLRILSQMYSYNTNESTFLPLSWET